MLRRFAWLSMLLVAPRAAAAGGWCPTGTEKRSAAEASLEALGRQIRSLPAGASTDGVESAFSAMLEKPCFRLAQRTVRPPWRKSAAAVREWWNGGLETWMRATLDEPKERSGKRYVVLPGEPRQSIVREEWPDAPVDASLLCPADDAGCGDETVPFLEHAEKALAAAPEPGFYASVRAEESRCVARAREKAPAARFAAWLACKMYHRVPVPLLPVGRLRSTGRGWLVIRGRRGHHEFCDEIRAYDLDSGSAYVACSCSRLALRRGGSVDIERTDASRQLHTVAGQVEPSRLREVVWALVVARKVVSGARTETFEVPAGIPIRLPRRPDRDLYINAAGWSRSDAQTTLSWALLDHGMEKAHGEMTWPDSASPGDGYPARLLATLEDGIRERCPPAALPPDLLGAAPSPPGVSHIDATPEQIDAVQPTLEASLLHAREGACRD